MNSVLLVILSTIYILIGLLHFYWLFGGKFGFENSIPTKQSGEIVLNPKVIDFISVGIGLILFGLYYVLLLTQVDLRFPNWLMISVGWVIPTIFFIRAIGDFNYVGFFKKVKGTSFAKADTKFFSVLCLFLALSGYGISLMN